MSEIKFDIFMRAPQYPVIVVSANRLYSAYNIKQLAKNCLAATPTENKQIVQVIDSTGEEFWFSPEAHILSPGFSFKKWTKKQIIETFNNSSNAKNSKQEYSLKSLSNKRLEKIINDICTLLNT